jgi:aspartate/methionine/tyrosine aminotransferase
MEWAKLHSTAQYNLATSGMVSLPLEDLGVSIEQLEINGASIYGYAPLLQAIAQRYRVAQESVVSSIGTSMANYLALASVTEPGDEILIEQPAYEPLLALADYLGLRIKRFQRPAEKNFAIDLDDLQRVASSSTRAIVITNMHNPTGAFCNDSTLREVAAIARRCGAYVLVDEVYREMLYERQPQSAFHIDPERFLITNSLTKGYGLSGLRCGWVLAPQEIAQRMWRINDVHGATFVHPGELLSVIAFEKLEQISRSMKSLLERNRQILREFLESRDDLDYYWPEYGTIVFPRLRAGNADIVCEMLRSQFDISVAPGRFFEMPDRIRIGVGLSTEAIQDALQQLSRGLDQSKHAADSMATINVHQKS